MNPRQETRRCFLKTAVAGLAAAGVSRFLTPCAAGAEETASVKKPRLTCSSVNYQSLPLDEACRRIADLGFEAIDIWDWPNCKHLESAANDYRAEGLAELLDKHKLELCGFSVYSTSFSKYAPLLGACGGGNAIRGTRGRTSENLTEDMKKFLEEIKPDLELCEKYNAYYLVENHSGNSLLNDLDSFKALLDLDLHPRLGIALAPYHILHNKESVTEALRLCRDRMRFIYLWTNESDEKQLPGLGTTDVSGWFKTLEEIEYAHYWTPFMHWEPEPDKMDSLHRQSLEFLRKYVNR